VADLIANRELRPEWLVAGVDLQRLERIQVTKKKPAPFDGAGLIEPETRAAALY